jgi:NAD(P)-dependent dehydrogenase (short-subunit alcohol dehydrogenase family)
VNSNEGSANLRFSLHASQEWDQAFAEPGRLRPPPRPAFRFRVRPPGVASTSGAPCSAQGGIYAAAGSAIKVLAARVSRKLRLSGDDMAKRGSTERATRHVVVTGGGTGIGRAIARRLDRDGASVTLVARDRGRLEDVAAALEHPAHVVSCDIRDRGRVERAFAEAAERLGPVHALVACSGLGGANGGDARSDRFDDLVATNLNGTYYCCRAALAQLAPGPETRHLVVMSSILARIAVPDYTGYSAAKTGLLGLVRSLAAEVAEENVQVNAICPGWVDTDMAWSGLDGIAASDGSTREQAYRDAMSAVPLGRMAQPEDIAGTVAWLLSPDARGVTGQAIDQNGGAWVG